MVDPEALEAHLSEAYAFRARMVFRFEADVILLREDSGRAWVARLFGPERPVTAVRGDAAILDWLARRSFPAERVIDAEPVACVEETTVLLTQRVPAVARSQRRTTLKAAGGVAQLGGLLGRLHRLDLDDPCVLRPGGARHHIAEGGPADELAVAARWLAEAEAEARPRDRGATDLRRVELAVDGYRRHVRLRAAEAERLPEVISARPVVSAIWRLHHHGQTPAAAAAAVRDARQVARAVADRARAAFRPELARG